LFLVLKFTGTGWDGRSVTGTEWGQGESYIAGWERGRFLEMRGGDGDKLLCPYYPLVVSIPIDEFISCSDKIFSVKLYSVVEKSCIDNRI